MASVVDLCNMALSHLGAETLIASISPPDGSAEAGYCATFYPMARQVALSEHAWTFAKTRAQLAQVTNPSTVWAYAYALPSDCVDPVRVLNTAALSVLLATPAWETTGNYLALFDQLTEQGCADYEVENGVLLTNEPEATLIYTRDVTDTTKWSALFTTGVAQLLAGYLAGPIIKGTQGIQIGKAWTDSGMAAVARAAAADANGSSERAEFLPQSIKARA